MKDEYQTINDNLKRMADALEEILRLVKEDLEKNGMADKPSHTHEEIVELTKNRSHDGGQG